MKKKKKKKKKEEEEAEEEEEEEEEDMYWLPRECHVASFFMPASSDGAEVGTRE
jgi:hypothetical protein